MSTWTAVAFVGTSVGIYSNGTPAGAGIAVVIALSVILAALYVLERSGNQRPSIRRVLIATGAPLLLTFGLILVSEIVQRF